MFDSMKVEGNAIRLKFTHIGQGLMAKGGDLKTFTIAGKDTLVVSSPDVPEPSAVRYAWDNYPEGANFYNSDGLPAAPFRTDNWAHELQ
jgi:sialate O-acetylesterase